MMLVGECVVVAIGNETFRQVHLCPKHKDKLGESKQEHFPKLYKRLKKALFTDLFSEKKKKKV